MLDNAGMAVQGWVVLPTTYRRYAGGVPSADWIQAWQNLLFVLLQHVAMLCYSGVLASDDGGCKAVGRR